MKHFKLLSIQAAPPSSPSPPPFSSSILNLIAHGVSFRGRLSPFEATKLCSCAGSAKNDTCEIWPEVARGGKFSRDRSRLYRGRFFAIWIFWHCPTLCPTSSPTSFCDLKQIRKNNICIYLLVPQSNHISRFFGPRFIFSPRRFIVEYSRCLSVCVSGEWSSAPLSKKWWVLDPGGGCRAKSLQTQDSRLQDSKAHDAAVHWLCNDIAPSADGAAPDSFLFGDRRSLGRAVPGLSPMVRWKFKRRLHTCTSSCPGGCPLAARSKFAQRAALCTHSLSHKPCGRICRKRATPTLRSEDVKNSTAENHLKDRPTTFSRTLSILTLFPYPDWWRGGLHYPMCVKMSERKSSNHWCRNRNAASFVVPA